MPRTSPFSREAAHQHLLQPLHAGDDEAVAPAARCSRRGGAASSSAARTRRRASRRCRCGRSRPATGPARRTSACRSCRGVTLVASLPGRPTRAPVTGSSASRQPTSCLRGSTAAASASRSSAAHHAGDRILVPRLVGLHGRDQPLAEFAVDRAGVVAAPGRDRSGSPRARPAGSRHRCPAGRTAWRRRAGGGAAAGRGLGVLAWRLASRRPAFVGSGFGRLRLRRLGFGAALSSAGPGCRRWRRCFGAGAGLARGSPCASAAEAPKITAKIAAETRIRTPTTAGAAP